MLKKTPLHYVYSRDAGVKFVDFGGWEMPLQFIGGILSEHHAVRHFAGLFDVSHMGEIRVQGIQAEDFLDELLTNRIRGSETGRCIYSPMCREDGGIVDDLLVYVLENNEYLLVVNASNIEKDYSWIQEKLIQSRMTASVENVSSNWAPTRSPRPGCRKAFISHVERYRVAVPRVLSSHKNSKALRYPDIAIANRIYR